MTGNEKNPHQFGSYQCFMWYGVNSTRVIRSIRAGGYSVARKHTAFYSSARSQDAQARRAVSAMRKLGNPVPYYWDMRPNTGDKPANGRKGGMLLALSWLSSIEHGRPYYVPMKGFTQS